MRPIVIESPYAGDVERNVAYARRCLLDSLRRGEAPFASHLLYTQVLDDLDPAQRKLGIEAGLVMAGAVSAWIDQRYEHAFVAAFYTDLGWSKGMLAARDFYTSRGYLHTQRTIGVEG